MKKLSRFHAVWQNESEPGYWVAYTDVKELETYAEFLKATLLRIVNEATEKRIQWTAKSNWLATSHNGNMYALLYEIDADLMNAVRDALNAEPSDDEEVVP